MTAKLNDFKKVNDDINDIDEIGGTDIKINPDYYIHNAILKAQSALTKDNVKDGFLQFYMLIEHIEILCKSAKMIPEDYEDQIKKFEVGEGAVGMAKVANLKLKLLMDEVFNNKVATEPLKI